MKCAFLHSDTLLQRRASGTAGGEATHISTGIHTHPEGSCSSLVQASQQLILGTNSGTLTHPPQLPDDRGQSMSFRLHALENTLHAISLVSQNLQPLPATF